MTALTPYLLFDGHCCEAMEFYKSCFGGELTVTKVKDSPVKDRMPAVQREKSSMHDSQAAMSRLRHPTGCVPTELQFEATRFVSS